jgi:hypothetical protein
MGKKVSKTKTRRALATTSERVTWLLDHVWDGNRSAMARDVGCSPSVLTKIAAGSQSPGRRLLTAISSHPKVNPSWLLAGKGEPLLADSLEVPAAGWPLPISSQALPGAPDAHHDILSGESFPTAGAFYRPSRYWLEVQPKEPLLRIRHLCLRPRDLLLVETDESWWTQAHIVHERICVVPAKKDNVELGFVTHYEGDSDDPAEYLSIDMPPDTDQMERRVIVDWKSDGRLVATERWLNAPLPHSRRVLLAQIAGLCMMVVRR